MANLQEQNTDAASENAPEKNYEIKAVVRDLVTGKFFVDLVEGIEPYFDRIDYARYFDNESEALKFIDDESQILGKPEIGLTVLEVITVRVFNRC